MRLTEKLDRRSANIELLRILSMIMIVGLHFLGFGGILKSTPIDSPQYGIVWTIEAFCFISVNCFVLISGYFMSESKSNFKVKKVIVLWLQVFFYSLVMYLILSVFKVTDFSISSVIKVMTPIISNQYWFAGDYLVLLIISPFLNMVIRSITQKQHFLLNTFLIITFSIVPTFITYANFLDFGGSYSITWFIVIYFVGAYIKKYPSNRKKYKMYLTFFISLALVPISRVLIEKSGKYPLLSYIVVGFLKGNSGLFYSYNSILIFIASVSFFEIFLSFKIKNIKVSRVINFFAGYTFAVYLIHQNNFIQTFLWNFINPSKYLGNSFLFVYMIIVLLSIFVICCLIEFLRSSLFDLMYKTKWFNNLCETIQKKISAFGEKHCLSRIK